MNIHSIFQSINGEVCDAHQGSVCTFIRFQGCNLKCKWCDTPSSRPVTYFNQRTPKEMVEFLTRPAAPNTTNITITGGEPFLQEEDEFMELICLLLKENKKISIETNGSIIWSPQIDSYKPEVSIVMDIKPPSSKIPKAFTYLKTAISLVMTLREHDWVKFPIQDETDYTFAKNIIKEKDIWAKIAFSPVSPLSHKHLLDWMYRDKVTDVVLNVQLHKLINVA